MPHLHSPVLPVLQITQPQLGAVDGRRLAYPFELEDGAFDEEDGVLQVCRSAQEQQLRLDRIRGVGENRRVDEEWLPVWPFD